MRLIKIDLGNASTARLHLHAAETMWVEEIARLFTASIFRCAQAPLAPHVGTSDLDRELARQLRVAEGKQWNE